MKILLIGPQGSGKSTQGKFLAKYLKVPFISTGDILREMAKEDNDEGKRIRHILDEGRLVDDETVISLIRKRVQRKDSRDGFILDGYPRTLEQAYKLDELNFDKALYFKVSKEIVLERMLERGREDDTDKLIKKRLEIYFQQTESLLNYYKNKEILIEIDGEGSIEQIQQRVRNELNGLQ